MQKHGARSVKIFGSYVRGDAGQDSDLDVLVEFHTTKSLLELISIEQELEEILGLKVDLLTRESISPYLIGKIEEACEVLLDEKGR